MAHLSGKWAIAKHGKLDGVIAALEIPADKQPKQPITGLTMEIRQDGNDFEIKSSGILLGTRETSFTIGSTFYTALLAGSVVAKVTASLEGDQLVITGEKGNKLIREVVDGQLVATIIADGNRAKFYFNKA